MADPLSFTASIIALAGLATQVGKAARKLYNASDEVVAIQNEITDLQALLKLLHTLGHEEWKPQQRIYLDHALLLLEQTKSALLELNELLYYRLLQPSGVKTNRLGWVAHGQTARRIRDRLSSRRQRLLEIFQLVSTSTTRCVDFKIEELQLQVQNVRDANMFTQTETLCRLAQVEQLIRNEHLGIATITEEKIAGKGLADVGASRSRRTINVPQSAEKGFSAVLSCSARHTGDSCPPFCSCQCHKRHAFSTPMLFDRLVGRLFLGYCIKPDFAVRCDETRCKGNKYSSWRFQYTFPSWFLRYSFAILTSTSAYGAPELILRLPRVRPSGTPIFEDVKAGAIDAVKNALATGTGSVHDVDYISEHSLLHMALAHKQPKMCEFLLEHGADINAVNRKRNSCGDIFWTIVLSRGLPPQEYEHLLDRFQGSTYIEEGQFSVIHKIIFGLSQTDLEETLRSSTNMIDQQDAYGRTPLAWAAARADLNAVSILLRFGSNPNIYEWGGWGPLHNSMLVDEPMISLSLLEGGADPNAGSRLYNETPLYIACRPAGYKCHIANLLKFGADPTVNLLDFYMSPLQCAADRDCPDAVRALITHTPQEHHTLALVAALRSQAMKALDVLVEHGADCKSIDARGRSIFHHAATHGSAKALTFLGAVTRDVSVHLADSDGLCAAQLAAMRSTECGEWKDSMCHHRPHCVNEEWWRAWIKLTGMRRAIISGGVDDAEDDTDLFVDALDS